MGGGGSYYDRDTNDGYVKNSVGVSKLAEETLSRREIDPGLLPKGRKLTCKAKSPVVYAFDVTGSMNNLPMIIFDKMPMIAGQIVENGYLDDPQVSLAAVGDITCDNAPLQVGDFSQLKKLDDWLKRIWREKGGGNNAFESYEMIAYYYAKFCNMPNAVTPFFLITGDEDFCDTLYESDLARHFGGTHETVEAKDVFAELKKKFKGNVYLIKRKYQVNDEKITAHWESVLGKECVVRLGSDEAIADVTLGVFALATGTRTLEEYLNDLKTARNVPQTDERVAEVRKALQTMTEKKSASGSTRTGTKGPKRPSERRRAPKKDDDAPSSPSDTGGSGKKKRGRL